MASPPAMAYSALASLPAMASPAPASPPAKAFPALASTPAMASPALASPPSMASPAVASPPAMASLLALASLPAIAFHVLASPPSSPTRGFTEEDSISQLAKREQYKPLLTELSTPIPVTHSSPSLPLLRHRFLEMAPLALLEMAPTSSTICCNHPTNTD